VVPVGRIDAAGVVAREVFVGSVLVDFAREPTETDVPGVPDVEGRVPSLPVTPQPATPKTMLMSKTIIVTARSLTICLFAPRCAGST